jgi:hypothetical protein
MDCMAVWNCVCVYKILFIFATDELTIDLCEITRNVYEKLRISIPTNTSGKKELKTENELREKNCVFRSNT